MKTIDKIETLCNICGMKITADVIEKDHEIYYKKNCSNTKLCVSESPMEVLVSTNSKNYTILRQEKVFKNFGMGILEIIQSCNIKCATCIASSEPEKEGILSLKEIEDILNKIEKSDNKPDILVLSGGEPTIHPEFINILKFVSKKDFKHIILITNGIILAEDIRLSQFLKTLNKKIEIYLQFDSTTPKVLEELRGEDLSNIRLKSLENLNKFDIPTTLVSVVKKGLNENEICDVINTGLSYKCVRGITFQPIRETGRHSSFNESNTITLSEVCSLITEGIKLNSEDSFQFHHMNPNHIAYLYYRPKQNTNKIYEFLRTNNQFFLYPEDDYFKFEYLETFRIFIVEYMDKFNFNYKDLNMSAIGVIQKNGDIIPIEKHYSKI